MTNSVEELKNKGIVQLTKQQLQGVLGPIKQVLTEIIEVDAQDVIIIENEKVELKIRGVLTISEQIEVWGRDSFNYFVGTLGREAVKGRPMDYDKNYVDKHACELLLEHNNMSYDFNMSLGETKSLRVHMYSVYNEQAPNKRGLALAIRVVNRDIPSWDTLHLPSFFRDVSKAKSGLVLIAGHVGSGKSTTVASLVKDINLTSSVRKSVVTIEHPIEYRHKSSGAKVVQKGVDVNTPSFSQATDDAMRENADIIVIGELRSQEEMDNALRLVEIGKLVLATIHSNSVSDTPDRFVNMFPGDIQDNIRDRLASNTICIMHQNLETIDGKQYPSVEGFYARNDTERSLLQRNFSRTQLSGFLKQKQHNWVINKEDAFEELLETATFNDKESARAVLTKS